MFKCIRSCASSETCRRTTTTSYRISLISSSHPCTSSFGWKYEKPLKRLHKAFLYSNNRSWINERDHSSYGHYSQSVTTRSKQEQHHHEKPVLITAALTGDVPSKNRHMRVPLTPEEIIQDTCEVFEAGARMIHVHVRDDEGKPTYKYEYYERVLEGVRKNCPEMIVQFSTGNYAPNVEERVKCFQLEQKPDMGSWTPGSTNFVSIQRRFESFKFDLVE